MGIIATDFKGLFVFEPQVFEDKRGYFLESYNAQVWAKEDVHHKFVQDNESKSKYGSIRGLHYQISPFPQTKLVRVTKGKVIDVVVDLRKEEPTFGKSFSIVLSQKNKKQLLIPQGFAHGFATLSKTAVFSYKCDNFYSKENERQINPLDKTLNIDWRIKTKDMIISDKDSHSVSFEEHYEFR